MEEHLRKVFNGKKNGKYEDLEVSLDPNRLTESLPHWKSGVWAIDFLIGGRPNAKGILPCPGIPKGKVIQLYGLESTGKTTMALTWAAAIQKQGGTVLYIDCEHEINIGHMTSLGVDVSDPDKFRMYQPENMEQALAIAWTAASAGVSIVIFDSVAGVSSKAESEKNADMEAVAKIGDTAKKWAEKLPGLHNRCARTGTIFVGISQMRMNIGVMGHGDKYTIQGGMAWKFWPALRIRLTSMFKDKGMVYSSFLNATEEKVIGVSVKAKLDKCKISGEAQSEIEYYYRFNYGIDNLATIMQCAIAHKLVKKQAAWLYWTLPDGTEASFNGSEKFRAFLQSKPDMAKALENQVLPRIFSSKPSDEEEEDVEFGEVPSVDDGEDVIDLEAELESMMGGSD